LRGEKEIFDMKITVNDIEAVETLKGSNNVKNPTLVDVDSAVAREDSIARRKLFEDKVVVD